MRPLVIAILAKQAAHILPLYLKCIEKQTALSNDTIFYVRTNDNTDNTSQILFDWCTASGKEFYFDDSSIDGSLSRYENHEWNPHRFSVLGKIRQESVNYARSRGADYFIADVDNLILPQTIKELRNSGLPVVAPMLTHIDGRSYYSNFHYDIDNNGYYKESSHYYDLLYRKVKGLIEVPVVHCTYFIRHEFLESISYLDKTDRYEYVIFSDSLRKANIPQYLDNRQDYGRISFSSNREEMVPKERYDELSRLLDSLPDHP